jgi:hypothetical protein
MFLGACGDDDLPSKSEFVAQVKKSMGTDVTDKLEDAGIEKDKANTAMENFLGCLYDRIKTDEDLLRKAYDEGGDQAIQTQIEKKAGSCTADLTKELTGAAASGG